MMAYRLNISFVVDEDETEETIQNFLEAFQGATHLNAGDNEEGPFIHGTMADLKVTRAWP